MINQFIGKYRFLSNFWYYLPDNTTVEHLYQASKTTNEYWRNKILKAAKPGIAKRLGNECPIREDWDQIKDLVMKQLVEMKFQKDKILTKKLIETGDTLLIEGNNWHDNYWGHCFCNKCKNVEHQNKLGKILMNVRKQLRKTND